MAKVVSLRKLDQMVRYGSQVRRTRPNPVFVQELVEQMKGYLPTAAEIATYHRPPSAAEVAAMLTVEQDGVADVEYVNNKLRLKLKNGKVLEVRIAGTTTVVQTDGGAAQTVNQTILQYDSDHVVSQAEFGTAAEILIEVDASAGNVTVTLPPGASVIGKKIHVKKMDTSNHRVIIAAHAGEVIDLDSTFVICCPRSSYELFPFLTGYRIV